MTVFVQMDVLEPTTNTVNSKSSSDINQEITVAHTGPLDRERDNKEEFEVSDSATSRGAHMPAPGNSTQ